MGAGQFFRGMGDRIDDALVMQADARANAARARANDEIKGGMERNRSNGANAQKLQDAYIPGMDADTALQLAAETERGVVGIPGGPTERMSIEGINNAMVNDPVARYGYSALAVGGASAGLGGMTAGAQKLASIMGLLQEAQEVEIARDNELHS